MVLEPEAVVGTPAREYLHLGSDTVFTIGLTPNRVDGASHIGVARDLSAWLKLNGLGGELTLPDVSSFREGDGESIPIEVVSHDELPAIWELPLPTSRYLLLLNGCRRNCRQWA